MAVVSDNWTGLEDGYRELGIERYFAGFVISEVLGCHGVALTRGAGPTPASVPAIRSLDELLPIVNGTP